MSIRSIIQGFPTHSLQTSSSLRPHVLPAERFSQCGGFQRVTFLEIFSPTEIVVKTENGLRLRVQPHDNSLQYIDEKSLSVFLQNIALKISNLSDGSFKLSYHVTGLGGGSNSSKPEGRQQTASNKLKKEPSPKTLSSGNREVIWYRACKPDSLDIYYVKKALKYALYEPIPLIFVKI